MKKKTIDDPSDEELEEAEEEPEVVYEIKNKPVDRKNKLTKTERNTKLVRRLQRKIEEKKKEDRRLNQKFNEIPMMIKDEKHKAKATEEKVKKRV